MKPRTYLIGGFQRQVFFDFPTKKIWKELAVLVDPAFPFLQWWKRL